MKERIKLFMLNKELISAYNFLDQFLYSTWDDRHFLHASCMCMVSNLRDLKQLKKLKQ